MTIYRPHMQHQGPDSNCIINGRYLGWESCTAFGMAMAADASTRGRVAPDGCGLREASGDTVGGQMMRQLQPELTRLGVPIQIYTGSNVATPAYVARRLWADRPVSLQGNTGAFLGTPYKCTDGAVNHLITLIYPQGGTSDAPATVQVFDSAADGRRPDISAGPSRMPWSLVLKFAARLHPWGEDDPRVLGPGKFYCSIFPAIPPDLPDTGTGYTLHIKARAKVRVYDLYKGDRQLACIESWKDVQWPNRSSQAPCLRPVHRETCDGKSGAVTVKVTSGAFKDEYVRVGVGTTVTGG